VSVPVERNTAGQIVYVALFDGADIVTTPTIAAGDIQISLDGGAFNNMVTLPSETPAASGQVQIPLSQAETNAVHIAIRGIDQAGAQWDDFLYSIFTDTDTIGGLSATLTAIQATLATILAAVQGVCACVTGWFSKHVSSITSRVKGSDADIIRGDTMELTFERIGDISTRANMWFTVKDDKDDTDSGAFIQIDENNGLLFIAGGAPAAAANGSIVVADAVAGTFTVTLAAVESAKLSDKYSTKYDVQILYADAAATVSTPVRGVAHIIGDVTRATS
jgi:hypothetical protein